VKGTEGAYGQVITVSAHPDKQEQRVPPAPLQDCCGSNTRTVRHPTDAAVSHQLCRRPLRSPMATANGSNQEHLRAVMYMFSARKEHTTMYCAQQSKAESAEVQICDQP